MRPRYCILPAVTTLLALCFALSAHAKKPPPEVPPAWKPGEAASASTKAGNAAVYASDWPGAEKSYREALATEPSCGMALLGLGKALVMQGRAADAVEPLQKASGAFAEQLDPHIWLGRALYETGRHGEAVEAARKAIVIKPGSAEAQTVAQRALRVEKRYSEAHEMVTAARGVANIAAWDCFDGVLFALQDRIGDASKMSATCSGSPDPELYKELTTAIMEAIARAEAAAPAPPPGAPPPPPPTPKKKK
jgi:tetratricopeptide (TPR) repeat protein